jgi:hypothetical protein
LLLVPRTSLRTAINSHVNSHSYQHRGYQLARLQLAPPHLTPTTSHAPRASHLPARALQLPARASQLATRNFSMEPKRKSQRAIKYGSLSNRTNTNLKTCEPHLPARTSHFAYQPRNLHLAATEIKTQARIFPHAWHLATRSYRHAPCTPAVPSACTPPLPVSKP